MSWHRIDERREISADFITCAEYQLFLDEKRAQGEYRQPDHWDGYRFPKGYAQEPILGVWAKDARQFCEWLNQQQSDVKYRLPILEEISDYPDSAKKDTGCWCIAGGKSLIYGYEPNQLKKWQQYFFSTFSSEYGKVLRGRFSEAAFSPTPDFTLDSILALDFTLAFLLALELATSHRDFPLTLDNLINRKQSTYRVFDIVRALDEVRTLYRARTLNNNLDFDRIRARARAIGLNDSLILALYNVYSQTRAHDFDHTLPFDCTLDLDRCFTPNNLFALRGLCCILICLEILTRNKHSNFKRRFFKRLLLGTTKTDPYHNIEQKQNPALNLYAAFFLIDERRKGNLPAWEGIRIVREWLE